MRKVFEILRDKEIAVAKVKNDKCVLRGDVEVDEHSIRSFHVSPKNDKFKAYRSKALVQAKHKYYLNYIRVIGARQRGTRPY